MSGGDPAAIVYLLLALLLPLGALARRGMGPGRSVRLALVWAAIFAGAIILFAQRDRLTTIVGGVRHPVHPEAARQGATGPDADDVSTHFPIDGGATNGALGVDRDDSI